MKEQLYWKKFSYSYKFSERVGFVKNLHNVIRQSIINGYLDKNIKILDVGCGSGINTIFIASKGYEKVFGLDPGEDILNMAKKKLFKTNLKNCEFILDDITNRTRFDDNYFDVIFSTHAFQKIDNYNAGLREIYRILKPGGKFYLTIPSSTESFYSWFKRYIKQNGMVKAFWDIRWLLAWTLPYVLLTKKSERKNENRWTIEKMGEIVENNGFKKINVKSLPYFHVGCTFGVFEK
jgi:ubiquinone/menaquinone biosynthesis C-methylase UbiE